MLCVSQRRDRRPRSAGHWRGTAEDGVGASTLEQQEAQDGPAQLRFSDAPHVSWICRQPLREALSIVEKREGLLGRGGGGGRLSRSFLSKNRRKQIGTGSRGPAQSGSSAEDVRPKQQRLRPGSSWPWLGHVVSTRTWAQKTVMATWPAPRLFSFSAGGHLSPHTTWRFSWSITQSH